ncbi:hypothetical protein Tco_0162094 [Tanacetum coccineum]
MEHENGAISYSTIIALWTGYCGYGDAPYVASISVEGPIPPKTVEQKLARKNELKAKNTLLLAIPDEHLLKFHGIKDAKTLWEAIKASYLLGDANLKLLRSLPSAWNNIALIMRNKADLDELSMDDLYNNLKKTLAVLMKQLILLMKFLSANSQGDKASSLDYVDAVMAPRNQGNRNGDAPRRIVPVETSANALVVQDRMGYD